MKSADESENGNSSRAPGQLAGENCSVPDIARAGIPVESLIEAKAVLPVGLRGDTEIHVGLFAPVHFGRDRNEALFRHFAAGLPDVGVHAKHLVKNNDCGCRQRLRPQDVGAEFLLL